MENYSPISGGAIAVIIKETATELISRGHQVSVLTRPCGDELYDVGRIIPISAPDRGSLSLPQRLVCKLQRTISNWDYPYYGPYIGSVLKQLRSIKPNPERIIIFNDLFSPKLIHKSLKEPQILVWLQNEQKTNQPELAQTLQATHKFLTCSQYIKDWASNNLSIQPEQIVVAPSGVNGSEFFPAAERPSMPGQIRCLCVGRIDPNKGQDLAVDAVRQLQSEGIDVSLTIAGDVWFYKTVGDPREQYKQQLVEQTKTIKNAQLLGHVPHHELPAIYRQHDVVFVLSRSNEPFGLVALEAMASGCAVISSNRGGLPEACGDAAMLVNPDDPQAIVSSLRKLCTDPATMQLYRSASISHAAQSTWLRAASCVEHC